MKQKYLIKIVFGKESFEASSHCSGGSISKMVKVPSIISVDSFIEQILGQLFLVCTVYSINSCVCSSALSVHTVQRKKRVEGRGF